MYTIKTENLILGGGASGLSLAKHLGNDTVILSENIGGLLRSFKSGDFTFDYGGHVYTTKDPDVVNLMKKSEGFFFDKRKAYYLAEGPIDGEKVPFPVQGSGYFEVRPNLESVRSRPRNFKEWSIDTFGDKFCSDFFLPFNRRVWGVDPRVMAYDWIENRVAPPGADARSWGTNSSFWYAPGNKLVKSLRDESEAYFIEGKVKNISQEAKRVQFDASGYYADQASGNIDGEIEYRKLFVTIPFHKAPLSNGMLAIGIGLNKILPYDFHWVYPHVSSPVHRVTLLSRYHKSMAPAFRDSLLLEIPSKKGPMDSLPNWNILYDDRKELAMFYAQSAGFLDIEREDIETVFYHFEERSMPVPALTLREYIAFNKGIFQKRDIFFAGRWGSHGYWNLQDILKDAEITALYAKTRSDGLRNDYLLSSFYYK